MCCTNSHSGSCRYGVDLAKQLSACLHGVLETCGSVRISFSERTPEKVLIYSSYFAIGFKGLMEDITTER